MEKLGGPGPRWSPPYDPSPQMPKHPTGSGGQAGATQAVLFPGIPEPLVVFALAPPDGCGTAWGSGCHTALMTGCRTKEASPKRRWPGNWTGSCSPWGRGQPEATVTDCSQTKDTGHACGAAGCCVWDPWREPEPWVFASTSRAPSAGFSSIPHRLRLGRCCLQAHLVGPGWPSSLPKLERNWDHVCCGRLPASWQ